MSDERGIDMRRRAVLATLGTGVFAGCSSINALGGPTFEKAPVKDAVANPKDLHQGDENKAGSSARLTLEKGQYFARGFAWPSEVDMRITGQIMKNGPIDLYVMTTSQLNDFQKQPQLINAMMKEEGIKSMDVQKTLDSGQYHLVFDNSQLGEASPSGTAEIQFKFELLGQATPTPTQSG
jgi:hypothetical protein